ncbi:MAG TPA: hypothetical protein VF338_08435, partial [Leptolinea sp.]
HACSPGFQTAAHSFITQKINLHFSSRSAQEKLAKMEKPEQKTLAELCQILRISHLGTFAFHFQTGRQQIEE